MSRIGTVSALETTTDASGVVVHAGRVDYESAWTLQRRLVEDRIAGRAPDTLLLLEHDPVFTVGRTGRAAHWGGDESTTHLAGIPLLRVERGGSVTYHGPGQLVGYPILRLNRFCAGPKAYVRLLEEVIIRTLARWGLAGCRVDRQPGVWVDDGRPAKIAAIGARVDRGVTMHGFALNVTMDLRPFSRIVPCGIADCRVTSMAELAAGSVELDEVRRCLADQFADVFGLEWTEVPG
jgi:lipoate-protein ligase B